MELVNNKSRNDRGMVVGIIETHRLWTRGFFGRGKYTEVVATDFVEAWELGRGEAALRPLCVFRALLAAIAGVL